VRLLVLAHGPSVHTRRWIEALAARGHVLRLLTARAMPDPIVPGRVVGWPLPWPALRYPSARGAVRAELREFRPDVTVAHFLPNYGFLAALAGARPLLLVCWGSDLLLNATRTPLHRSRARYTLDRADLIHVDARVLTDAAVRLGARPERIWTRAWGVDAASLSPACDWAARRGGVGTPLRVLSTRLLEPLYDPESLLRGLGLLARRGVAFEATLAGDGPLRAALEDLARREGIAERVRFVGWVDQARLYALLREHHVYVSLSRSDSTSQSLLEAMAAGLLPVVSDIAGNREWVMHRRSGYLVPTGDPEAVAATLAEAAASAGAAGMADAARSVAAERADWSVTLEELERRLAALAGGGGRAR
jgi:glycosyltransferase involved in cell wall biosynthesis